MEETLPTQVIEVVEVIDYTESFNSVIGQLVTLNELTQYLTGFVLFFVIVILCCFVYKFFRIFF